MNIQKVGAREWQMDPSKNEMDYDKIIQNKYEKFS